MSAERPSKKPAKRYKNLIQVLTRKAMSEEKQTPVACFDQKTPAPAEPYVPFGEDFAAINIVLAQIASTTPQPQGNSAQSNASQEKQ
jgi:hypothetical protein